ncbi:MAG: hypothetical protein WA639_25340 [Candidatus Acidiferrum sp.]
MKQQPDKEFILECLQAVARGAGRSPSRSEFISLSGISEHQISLFFPSWNDAVRAAGLVPNTLNIRLEDRELLEDWGDAVRRSRAIPARRTYRHLGKFDHRTFERRFGLWSKLPETFRNFAQGKPEWADVLALLPPPAPKAPPKPQPLPHVIPNPAPVPVSLPAASPTSTDPRSALSPAPFSPSNHDPAPNRQSSSTPPPRPLRHPPLQNRPTYGKPMDFRGIRYEPVNEQGVVLLFGMVARELGYRVEAVQSGFPDCEAQRQIAPHRWQRVHIEFESRNFRDHGHPLTGCDVIVCWRHNWPDHPPHLEILELSSLIKSLPTSDDGPL